VEKQINAKVEELDGTRKVGLVFMDVVDAYQEETEKQIKIKTEQLEDTMKAGLVFMDAADTYQEEVEKQIKTKIEELEGTRKASLVFIDDVDAYQEEAGKKIKAEAEKLETLGAQNAEMDERLQSLELELHIALAKNRELEAGVMEKKIEYDLVKVENYKLRTEVLIEQKYGLSEADVESINMELDAPTEIMEAVLKEFDAGEPKITKAAEDLKTNGENERLLEVFVIEQKHSLFELEVERLKVEPGASAGKKEAIVDAFDAQKEENTNGSKDLKREVEEVCAIKHFKRSENGKLRSEVLTTEQQHDTSNAEVERLKMDALVEAKELLGN
jgi:hypothetical protein